MLKEAILEIIKIVGIACAVIALMILFGFVRSPAACDTSYFDSEIRCWFVWLSDGRMRTCCWYPASQQQVCN